MSDDLTETPEPPTPWLRYEGEPEGDYALFLAYRALPKGHKKGRSLAKLALAKGCSTRNLENKSTKWAWVARCEAYDAEVYGVREDARIETQARESAKWDKRRQDDAESGYRMAVLMEDKVLQMLKHPLLREKSVEKYGDGRIKTVVYEPANWTIASASRAAKLVMEIKEAARNSALDDELDRFDPATATPEECARILAAAKARRDAFRRIQVETGPES